MKTVMKKEYISPEAIAIKIQTMGMLAVSGFDNVIDPTPDPSEELGSGDMLAPEEEFDFEDDYNFDE